MSSASTTRQGALVGCFTLIGLFILIAAVFTIGSMNEAFSRKIQVSAVFDQVDGLKQGDSVWFSGVSVGTVRSVQFVPGPSVEVAMALDANVVGFIAGDVVAQVSTDGLIGNNIIALIGGTPQSRTLQDGDVLGVEVAVSMAQLMVEARETNDKLQIITARLANGEGTVGKLLTEEGLYDDVQATVTSLKSVAGRADDIALNLSTFTRELNREGALPHNLVTDQTTYASLVTSVDSLQTTAHNASAIMDGMQASMADTTTPIGVLLHDQEAGTDLSETFESMSDSSKLLAEDLEALQHNFLLKGFFKKKERKEQKAAKKAAKN
jgi:phospholipid/cholesterol/gamma-HCH transport system substrate-binding protein